MSVAQKSVIHFYQVTDSAVNLLASICCILTYTIVLHFLSVIRQIKQDWCAVLTKLSLANNCAYIPLVGRMVGCRNTVYKPSLTIYAFGCISPYFPSFFFYLTPKACGPAGSGCNGINAASHCLRVQLVHQGGRRPLVLKYG